MMRSRNLIFLFLGLFLSHTNCRCDDESIGTLSPELEISPTPLTLPSKPAGIESRGVFTARNSGEAPLRLLSIESNNPLFVHDLLEPRPVAPGSSIAISVRARSSTVGNFEGILQINTDNSSQAFKLPVRFSAVAPPPCDDGNVCTEDRFDLATETCVHRFLNGTPCATADKCIEQASCQDGVCLGQTKVCNDDSPCTRDFCRQVDGECIFVIDDQACDDQNPCTTDSCTSSGCVNTQAPNGTLCDDNDQCSHSDACFAGICVGRGTNENGPCDDQNSCTENDRCVSGVCAGTSRIDSAAEGEVLFDHYLNAWPNAFMHRREVSLSDDDILYVLDHHPLEPPRGMAHVVSTMKYCGTEEYEFSYEPPDGLVFVRYVRREMQLQVDNTLRICVGVRQLPENGYAPQSTTYILDRNGQALLSEIRAQGGETGRSLLPDGSHIYGFVWPISQGAPSETSPSQQNLVIIREDRNGQILWRHERSSLDWAEFLGVAGPRVLFWSNFRFGALDFNTGATVWTAPTNFIAKEMALSTQLNLGVARVGMDYQNSQILGVEILNGRQTFLFPAEEDLSYMPRTDPVIAPDGRILVVMQNALPGPFRPLSLEWVELNSAGQVLSSTRLPYAFPFNWENTRVEDDPYITVAEDGVAYVGYGDRFWSINPGGTIRWTVSSTLTHGFTGAVPLLRSDKVLLINDGHRRIIGVKTNGAPLANSGWPTFRHDNRRTNFTP